MKEIHQLRTNLFYGLEAVIIKDVYPFLEDLVHKEGNQKNVLADYAKQFGYDPVHHLCLHLKSVEPEFLKNTGLYDPALYEENQTEEQTKLTNTEDEDPIKELNSLVGLKQVKADISSLVNLIRVRKMRAQKG